MSVNESLGLVMLFLMVPAIFIGFPISFTLLFLALVFGYIGMGPTVFDLMFFQTIGMMKEETLAAVPLFIFMGYILEEGGLMERLFRAFQLLLAPVRGSLYIGVLTIATIFGIAAGTVGPTVALMGIMAAPTMTRAGYDVRMSAGTITAGGTLGILIPPSVMLVVMGPVMGVSVAKLYASSFGPGFMLSGIFIAYALIRSYLQPHIGPALPKEQRATSYGFLLKELMIGMLPHGFLILATLGTILAGLATPTEAAAMGALGAFVLSIIYRVLTWKRLRDACSLTLQQSSMILFLVVASNVFGAVFARLGSANVVTKALLSIPIPPMGMLFVVMALIFLLGWPFEWPAIILVFVPLLQPVIDALKLDMLWFATLIAVNLQTAYLSPPVAMAAYYLKGVAPDWKLSDIYWGMAQFMVLQVIGLILCIVFPEIILWFPRWLFDRP
jgi:tripartite ATP-independent transporter DctM subunit